MITKTIRILTTATLTYAVLTTTAESSAFGAEPDGSSFRLQPSFDDREIYDTYQRLNEHGAPLFISTDLALHTGHLLFDYSLRAVESEHLFDQLKRLTTALLQASQKLDALGAQSGPSVTGYLAVAARLLDPAAVVPPEVADAVDRDLALIAKHQGGAVSAVLDNVEDFSQYVPRGHYTRNDEFARYFRAMMWYGRRTFRVEEARPDSGPPPATVDPWSDEHRRREVQMMLKLTWLLYDTQIDDEPATTAWRLLYEPTVQFAGKTEDLTPEQIKQLAEKLWHRLPSPEAAAQLVPAELDKFAAAAADLSRPKIDSSGMGRKGFCLMAQRFTPDSYVTQTLVTDGDRPFGDVAHPLIYTGRRDPKPFTWGTNRYLNPPERRFMPRGLDVMAVLGSQQASEILTADGDDEYQGYRDLVSQLSREVEQLRKAHRDESVYYAWLDVLSALIPAPQESAVPDVFRSAAWSRKELLTGLASWTELRHDTILYVKQSYTPKPRSAPPAMSPVYVEPYPEVFARAGQLVARLRDRLQALGVMPAGLTQNYDDYVQLMGELEQAARNEQAGRPFGEKAMMSLRFTAARLKGVTRLPPPLAEKLLGKADSDMAVVADVHTDANSAQALEEAVGRPLLLTITLPSNDGPVSFQGAAFSYFEFKQPMDDRLTDESWQARLTAPETRPPLPEWLPNVAP